LFASDKGGGERERERERRGDQRREIEKKVGRTVNLPVEWENEMKEDYGIGSQLGEGYTSDNVHARGIELSEFLEFTILNKGAGFVLKGGVMIRI
jgi:hypothetical protein